MSHFFGVIDPNYVVNGSHCLNVINNFIHSVRWSVYSLVWFFDSGPSQVTTSTEGGCLCMNIIEMAIYMRVRPSVLYYL